MDLGIVLARLIEIVSFPFSNPEIIWAILPLFLTLILMEFYFGRYSGEEMGFATAAANGTILLFTAFNLLRHIYTNNILTIFNGIIDPVKTWLIFAIAMIGIVVAILDFYHLLPKRIAFAISSILPVYVLAFVVSVIVYSSIPVDLVTLFAGVAIFVCLGLVFMIIHIFEPKSF